MKYYNQSKESSDAIAKITEKYEESGMRHKTPFSIIRELLEQNIISEHEYNDLIINNNIDKKESLVEEEKSEYPLEEDPKTNEHLDSDIKVLKEYLYKESKGRYLIWLQNLMLETCYVKLSLNNSNEFQMNDNIMEPTVYYFSCEYPSIIHTVLCHFGVKMLNYKDVGGLIEKNENFKIFWGCIVSIELILVVYFGRHCQ